MKKKIEQRQKEINKWREDAKERRKEKHVGTDTVGVDEENR